MIGFQSDYLQYADPQLKYLCEENTNSVISNVN